MMSQPYNKIADSTLRSFNTISATIHTHHREIFNFFDRRSTNSSSDFFYVKLKDFRTTLNTFFLE